MIEVKKRKPLGKGGGGLTILEFRRHKGLKCS